MANLQHALQVKKANIVQLGNSHFVIDIKSPDADPQYMAKKLTDIVMTQHAEKRVVFYSTNTAFLTALPNNLNRFESRDDTRMLLTHILLSGGQCPIDKKQHQCKWYGFELRRKGEVVEKFTLGEGRTATELVWNKAAMDCLRTGGLSVGEEVTCRRCDG